MSSEQISDKEKVRIVSNFIKSAPPGEFNEVFNDVRVLLDNDQLLKEGASMAFSEHNMDQFIPAAVENNQVLVTAAGKVEGGRFLDPRNKKSFKYDHLRKQASDIQSVSADETAEPWRSALDKAVQAYIKDHYPNGVTTVYGSSSGNNIKLTVCIEDHKYSPQNYWNGRWRSEWNVTFTPGGSAELEGSMKVQVHYYEDGNVQLVSNKDAKVTLKTSNEEGTAKEFVRLITAAENDYQSAVIENYKTMSQTTFKALRRQLPVTRAKVDWNKIGAYNVGQQLSQNQKAKN